MLARVLAHPYSICHTPHMSAVPRSSTWWFRRLLIAVLIAVVPWIVFRPSRTYTMMIYSFQTASSSTTQEHLDIRVLRRLWTPTHIEYVSLGLPGASGTQSLDLEPLRWRNAGFLGDLPNEVSPATCEHMLSRFDQRTDAATRVAVAADLSAILHDVAARGEIALNPIASPDGTLSAPGASTLRPTMHAVQQDSTISSGTREIGGFFAAIGAIMFFALGLVYPKPRSSTTRHTK